MRKVADGVTTTYVIAVLGLPQVLVETTGGQSTAYLYGHDLLAEEVTAWAWHLNDGLGSLALSKVEGVRQSLPIALESS